MKWTDREDAFSLKVGPIKNLVYVSKDFYRERKPSVIPLALFLAML
jgi:hypothetical protein